ncbi:MAG: DNA polymerase III subunit gamma/tau [Eubacterium sp.]|nr:DNA polymerase III subunit gamma/tau [Eubacterium sp.]
MSYQALYRKYRPKTFDEVQGQDAVVTTLKNQLKSGRVGHAYLFCGTRGTGKTTVAKIFAKALNCENLTENGPCCECSRCKAIEDGSSMNVVEIDGASNNRVDDIRQIVDEVKYSPVDGGKKVYIIDEVHMVTESGFNALLKTLEEPPEYLVFILATTDPQKVIPTIQSRCQRYDFKRISVETIISRMRDLLDREGVAAEDRALNYIARMADGALRDALSLLEECVSYYFGEELTFDKVLNALGTVDQTTYHEMTRAVMEGQVDMVVSSVEHLVATGRDLIQFAKEYVWYLRNLLIIKTSENARQLIDMSDENVDTLRNFAAGLEEEQIIRYIHVVSRLITEMRYSPNRRVVFEVALIRLCRPQMERDYDSLIDRMKVMERELETMKDCLEGGRYPQAAGVHAQSGNSAAGQSPSAPAKPVRPPAVPEEVQEVVRNWSHVEQAVSAKGNGLMHSHLSSAVLSVDVDGNLVLGMKEPMALGYFTENHEKLEALQEIIDEMTEKHVGIVVKDFTEAKTRAENADLRSLLPNVTIVEED